MPSRQAILDNVTAYEAEELVEYIKQGIVTFDELCRETDGEFSRPMREKVKTLLAGSEDEDWQKAKTSGSIADLQAYLDHYPDGKHLDEARELILAQKEAEKFKAADDEWSRLMEDPTVDGLREFIDTHAGDPRCREATLLINRLQEESFMGAGKEILLAEINRIITDKSVLDRNLEIYESILSLIRRKKLSKADLLQLLQNDHNLLSADVVRKLCNDGTLIYEDIFSVGIGQDFVQHLISSRQPGFFPEAASLERIKPGYTEVYFWGIPSSGKTCALGAILSVANSGKVAVSMAMDNDCQGYGYMNRLAALFNSSGRVCTLPPGTPVGATYEMRFDLEDDEKRLHPLVCVDLAGELFTCMYRSAAGEYMSDDDLRALQTLDNILVDNRTNNRKIHFFVIEYGAENRLYNDLQQSVYLESAVQYIRTKGIFSTNTDGIYLILTKVDKAKVPASELIGHLGGYIRTNYQGFYNQLKRICTEYDINDRKVEIVPFTLGNICFQDYCKFNGDAAQNVVRILLNRSYGKKMGKKSWFESQFRK